MLTANYLLQLILCYHISVSVGLEVSLQPNYEIRTLTRGSSLFVSCTAKGRSVSRIMWKDNDEKEVREKGSVRIDEQEIAYHNDLESRTLNLMISSLRMEDEGMYTCYAEGDGTSDSRTLLVSVSQPISFEGIDVYQEAEEGKDYTLTCKPKGVPQPTVTWQIPDGTLRYTQLQDGLRITNVTREDEGRYRCRAVQLELGTLDSIYIRLQVNHKPKMLTRADETVYSFVSAEIDLTCEVQAQPVAQFQWMRNGAALTPGEGSVLYFSNDRGRTSALKLKIHDEQDFGAYTCKASNSYGEVDRVLYLKKGVKPGVPMFQGKESHETALTLTISEPENEPSQIIGYRIQYKETRDQCGSARHQDFVFKGNDTDYQLQNLRQGTIYAIRVAAKNEAGIGDYTQQQFLSTEPNEVEFC